MSGDYQTVYGIGLLDDIHNYFPSILYQPQRFNSVQDLLLYVQQRTQARFNLFDYGRSQYARANPQFRQPAVFVPAQTTFNIPTFNSPSFNSPTFNSPTFNGILRSLIVPRGVPAAQASHASQAIIDERSTSEMIGQDLDDNCSVCQDSMLQGQIIRTLRGCGHRFHAVCVDNWLLTRSVLCPDCRHDIREPPYITTPILRARVPAQAQAQAETQATVENPNAPQSTPADSVGQDQDRQMADAQIRQAEAQDRAAIQNQGRLTRELIELIFGDFNLDEV